MSATLEKMVNKIRGSIQTHFSNWVFGLILALSGIFYGAADASTPSSWNGSSAWNRGDENVSQRDLRSTSPNYSDLSPYSPASHNLALDLGQVFLMGDLTRYADSIGSQLHYTYGVSDLFGFDTSLGYSEHAQGRYSMASLLSGIRMNLSWYDKIIPYGLLGLGFYRPTYQDPTATTGPTGAPVPSISSLLFGLHLGPGIDLQLSRNLFFGASLILHQMFGENTKFSNGTPLFAGGTYTSFFLHAGVSF